jgi:hypothetical protein
MNFITSICPKHTYESMQMDCLKEWNELGRVYSMNCADEIEVLKPFYPFVEFIETKQTAKRHFGKPYVYVDEILAFITAKNEPFVLINSDISIDKEQLKKLFGKEKEGLVYLHRWDYKDAKNSSQIYKMGIDALIINPLLLKYIPKTCLFLGGTYWDIVYPYLYLQAGVPIFSVRNKPVIFHKEHPARYSNEDWKRLGQHAGWVIQKEDFTPAQVSGYIYNNLNVHTQWISL